MTCLISDLSSPLPLGPWKPTESQAFEQHKQPLPEASKSQTSETPAPNPKS